MSLITASQVILDLATLERAEAIQALATTFHIDGRVADLEGFLLDVQRREEQMATGLPGGIAIPHSRSTYVVEPSLAFGRSADGIPWGADDGPANLVFLIGVPAGGRSDQLALLAKLARRLTKASFREQLLTKNDPEVICEVLESALIRT